MAVGRMTLTPRVTGWGVWTQTVQLCPVGQRGKDGPPADLSLPATQDPPIPSPIPRTTRTTMTLGPPSQAQRGSSPWTPALPRPRPTLSSRSCPGVPRSLPRGERKLHTLPFSVSIHQTACGTALCPPHTAAQRGRAASDRE